MKSRLFFIIFISYLTFGFIKGEYNVTLTGSSVCSGPWPESCVSNTNVTINSTAFTLSYDVATDCKVVLWKTLVYMDSNSTSQKNKQPTISFNTKDPCQHFYFSLILSQSMQADSNCNVKKGFYTTSFDLGTAIKLFYGKKFYYGTYKVKMSILSQKKNFQCYTFSYILEPKTKS